jgi:hypothetical protein
MTATELAEPAALELRAPDLENLASQDTGRATLSNTSIGTFLACEQKFEYHYEHRLSPAITATPLALGKAFSHALEVGDPIAGEMLLRRQADEENTRAIGNPWVQAPNERDVEIQATIVREASRAYLKQYGAHAAREVETRVRIRNPQAGGRYSQTHDLVCRVDGLAPDGSHLIEDKLVGKLDRRNLHRRVLLDRQITIEAYSHWRTTGELIGEIRYRATLKPQIKQRKDEAFDAYLARIAVDYRDRPDFYLAEIEARRSLGDFLRLERELWRWAEQIRLARRDGTFPRDTSACTDFGGCRYLALCCDEPGAEHQYVVRPKFVESDQPEEVETA